MKPWMAGLVRLGLAGSCLFWTGCGGSDVPDPDADSQAATDVAPKSSGESAFVPEVSPTESAPVATATAPTASAEPASPPVFASGPPPQSARDPRMDRIQAAAPAGGGGESEAAPAQETAAAPASSEPTSTESSTPVNTESSAATNEMLALASAAPAPEAAGSDGSKPSAPNAAGGGQGQGEGPAGARPPANYPGMPASGPPNAAGGNFGAMAGNAGGRRNAPGMEGMPGMGGPGGPGGRGGSSRPGSNAPASFRSPSEGVNSFLNALADKDLDRLAEATAKHAPVDAREKNRKLFAQILDGSLSPEDLDDLAKRLEDYQPVSADPPRSTGQTIINLEKMEDGALFGRKITTRKEKAGWKVQDIGGEIDFYESRKYTRKTR